MSDESKATAEYVVQMHKLTGDVELWQDIATVKVPAHTQRKTIIGRAIAESGVKPAVGGEPLRLRALDARSSHVTTVSAKAVDPQMEWS